MQDKLTRALWIAVGAVGLGVAIWVVSEVAQTLDQVQSSFIRAFYALLILILLGSFAYYLMKLTGWRPSLTVRSPQAAPRRVRPTPEQRFEALYERHGLDQHPKAPVPSRSTTSEPARRSESRPAQPAAARPAFEPEPAEPAIEKPELAKLEMPKRAAAEAEPAKPSVALASVAVCGLQGRGKSALVKALARGTEPGSDPLVLRLVELPSLSERTADNSDVLERASAADLALFVIDEDLVSYEFDALKTLLDHGGQPLVILNKTDRASRTALEQTRASVAAKLEGLVQARDIVDSAAHPLPAVRIVAGPDGEEREEEVERPPDVAAVHERLREFAKNLGRTGVEIVSE